MTLFGLLQWRPHLDPLLCGLLVLGTGVWVWFLYRRLLLRLPPRKAKILLIPKLLILILLLLALFEPIWTVEKRESTKGKLLALLDVSSSMDVVDSPKEARVARARAFLSKLKKDMPEEVTVEELVFDSEMRAATAAMPTNQVRGTDLGGSLVALSDRKDISSYVGVLLLTDGGDETVDSAALPSVPLYVAGFGTDPTKWNDVSVADVQAPASVEKDLEFEINVDLRAYRGGDQAFSRGLIKVPVKLELEKDGRWERVGDKTVDLLNRQARVNFKALHKELGTYRYRVTAELVPGELSALNNVRNFIVEVQQKTLHLLYYTREIGADFKLFRSELGRDPGISFTALFRTQSERFTLQGDRQPGDVELESGFPASEKTLQLYDVLVVGSFGAEDWAPPQLDALLKYISGGGVVVFMGGDRSFGRGGYAKTPLAAVFPWKISDSEPENSLGTFQVQTPSISSGHPILYGVEDQLIKQGAVIESVNLVGDLKVGATALLETRAGGRLITVVGLQNYNRGKVLGVASNTMWKWAAKSENLRAAYGIFWRQAIRNMTGKDEGGRVFKIKWDKDAYRPGEQAVPEIRVAGQQNVEGIRWVATQTYKKQTTPLTVEPIQGQTGAYFTKVRLRERGEYGFKLVAYRGENILESYEKVLRVAPMVDEGAHLELDEAFLTKLAERGSGAYYKEDQSDQLVKRITAGLWRKVVAVEASLVQTGPYFALLFVLILIVEWVLRRKQNLF